MISMRAAASDSRIRAHESLPHHTLGMQYVRTSQHAAAFALPLDFTTPPVAHVHLGVDVWCSLLL